MREYWDRIHRENNMQMISGYGLEDVKKNLRIRKKFKPKMNILEIGIGTGDTAIGLFKEGHNVFVNDISVVAIAKLYTKLNGFIPNIGLESIPDNYFDLILCHLVFQHIDDKERNQFSIFVEEEKEEVYKYFALAEFIEYVL